MGKTIKNTVPVLFYFPPLATETETLRGPWQQNLPQNRKKNFYSSLSKDFLRLAADDFFNGSDIKVAITGNGGHN